MTKTAILVLTITSVLQFLIQFSNGLMSAILATENGALPNWSSLLVATLGGVVAAGTKLLPVLQELLREYGLKVNGEASAVVKAATKITQ